tara:strand:+ start:84 stop:545 length:462 start_codon:yes stop_codon:yes gene_type:complete
MSKFIDQKERDIIFPVLHEMDRILIQEGAQHYQLYKQQIVKENTVSEFAAISGATGRCLNHLKGDYAESLAKMHFITKGYFIFPADSAKGYIDLIVIDRDGNLTKIDVKTITYKKDTAYTRYRIDRKAPSPQQKKDNVRLMHIDIDQRAFFMS